MTCITCTKLRPIKSTSSNNCKKSKQKIEEVRLYCPNSVMEVYGDIINSNCLNSYISNIVVPDITCCPTPFVCVEVTNPDDLDELNDYTFDRTEDTGTDIYSFTALKIKVTDPEQQCTIDSLKGQEVGILYKIENKSGDFVWRRLIMKLTNLTGGLLNGYELTWNTENPSDTDKPLFVNFGSADLTTTSIDALTDFDGTGSCEQPDAGEGNTNVII